MVEISSPKSGLKLAFNTNRASSIVLFCPTSHVHHWASSSEAGVMFYANGMAHPSTGVRKRVHGGSGLSGNGDSYGPGCRLFGIYTLIMNVDMSHDTKLPHSSSSTR